MARTVRIFVLALLLLPSAGLYCATTASAADKGQDGKPRKWTNVVLVMTDDQGYGDVGFHDNPMIRTPNLDALAKQSVRFTNFHVDPTCSETRAALLTGRYSARGGVWHTIMGRSILAPDETTMGDVFSNNGYRTGIFGKWHLGDNWPYRPQDRGFHEVLIHGGGGVGQTPDYWDNDYFDDTYFRNGVDQPQTGYCTDVFFAAGLKFIEQNRDQPFLCYIPTNAPHGPFIVADKYSEPYRQQGVPQPMANFYGMITNIDDNLGQLLEKLDQWKLTDNTLVIYLTDNGTAAGVAGPAARDGWKGFNAGMRGQKGSQYEGGHRVPCFVRLPKSLTDSPAVPREVTTLTAHFDLLPTLIDLCELEATSSAAGSGRLKSTSEDAEPATPPDTPAGDGQPLTFDGVSLRPLLLGEPLPDRASAPHAFDRILTVHSQRLEHPEKWRKCAVMDGMWRLVDGRELYDLSADPGQTMDLAAKHPETVRRLRQAYEHWWEDVSGSFADYSRIPLGDDRANPTTLTCHDWHAEISQVLWNHQMIKRMPEANGWWAVEVAGDGWYQFDLRLRPESVSFPLEAGMARVRVGDRTAEQPIAEGSNRATVRLQLKAGPQKLQTWLEEQQRGQRGAFFVTVTRLKAVDGDSDASSAGESSAGE